MKIDPENLSDSIDKIVQVCEEMEESKEYDVALRALTALSLLKLYIGIDRFEQLPAFERFLKMADNIVSKKEHDNDK